jgi:hypothetical protein
MCLYTFFVCNCNLGYHNDFVPPSSLATVSDVRLSLLLLAAGTLGRRLLLLLLLAETTKVLQARRLLELKAALTPPDVTCLSNWRPNSYPCDGPVATKWNTTESGDDGDGVGITCSGDGTVLELNVSCWMASGTLPTTLGRLPGLGGLRSLNLNLGWDAVTGTLPPEWGSGPGLVGLEYLRIHNDLTLGTEGLSGPLPPEWGLGPGLANLKSLEIGPWPRNSFVPCSWAGLDKLTFLRFSIDEYGDTPTGCLPSPQLADALDLQLMDYNLEGADLGRAKAAMLAGVRGGC